MPDALVHLDGVAEPLAVRVNGHKSTFVLGSDAVAIAAMAHPDVLAYDLLHIASLVFSVDGTLRRGGATRPGMGVGWRRGLHFDIEVSRPAVWGEPAVTSALADAARFLTDDDVRFTFRAGNTVAALQIFLPLDDIAATARFDEVILFSGGLDSFAGALETLATTGKRIILVTHRSAPKVVRRQIRLGQWLQKRFPGRILHLHVPAHRVKSESVETTQRSRSFLFAALGQVVARMFGCSQVTFFENGIVSHNLPFSPQVAGTMATRTTHPLALRLIEKLHQAALPGAVPLRTPYARLTKTEVVRRTAEHGGQSQIRDTVSCTHVREQDRLKTHCAACSQCFDRRFAILAAGLEAHEPPEMYRHDMLTGPRDADLSRTIALDWTRHAVRLTQLVQDLFLRDFGQEVMRIARGHADLTTQEVLRRTLEMHARHGQAVLGVLERAIAGNATALARQHLPPTSLLVMHAGSGVPRVAASDQIVTAGETVGVVAVDDDAANLAPDPDAPLTLELWMIDGRRRIDVRGLTTLSGRLADVPWELSNRWRADREEGLAPESHRFALSAEIAGALPNYPLDGSASPKELVNQIVRRCRKQVDTDFARITEFRRAASCSSRPGATRATGWNPAPSSST